MSFAKLFKEIVAQNKHELSLNGEKLIKLLDINEGKLDANLFKLKQLNFLQLSNSHILEDPVGKCWDELKNLHQLQLYGNKLTSIPGKNLMIYI